MVRQNSLNITAQVDTLLDQAVLGVNLQYISPCTKLHSY